MKILISKFIWNYLPELFVSDIEWNVHLWHLICRQKDM